MNPRIPLMFVYSIALVVFTLIIFRQVVYIFTEEIVFELFFAASFSVSIATLLIRLFIIDPHRFSSAIQQSDIFESPLAPNRFLNLMPIAMVICTVSDFLLSKDFVLGMLSFLAAQIVYILAYSGIVHLHPKSLFTEKTKVLFISSILVWTIIPAALYLFLIFKPADIMSLLVIPYVIFLCLMVLITCVAFGYNKRPRSFRLMIAGGATWFFISDSLLAINKFNTSITIPMAGLMIGATYLLGVFMLQYAVLLLRFPDGSTIMRSEPSLRK